jgi:hypothetical protein
LEVLRATHVFTGTLPFFAASRLTTRLRERGTVTATLEPDAVPVLPDPGRAVTRMLTALSRVDEHLLRYTDLPAGSSVVVAARRRMS